MNRETDFQRNVKWVIYMTAVVCALCQFILLFSEFNYLSGLGIIVNLLYHIAGVACPVFILYLFFSENKDKEIYGSYAIGGETFLSALVTLSIMIKYINKTKDSLAYSTAIVVFLVISIVFELLVGFLFIRYGQDKVTCVLPILTLFVSLILRDAVLSRVDSKLHVKVNIGYDELGNIVGTSFKGSFASGWTFLHAFFFLIFVVCVIIYVDTRFLEELKENPKDLFTRKTLFGTFTNGLMQEKKPKKNVGYNAQQTANTYSQQTTVNTANTSYSNNSYVSNGTSVSSHQIHENNADKSLHSDEALQGGIAVDSTGTSKENMIIQNSEVLRRDISIRKCPDCGSVVPEGSEMCMTCGCPMEDIPEVTHSPIKTIKAEAKPNTIGGSVRKCPDCGSVVPEGSEMCMTCGCPME